MPRLLVVLALASQFCLLAGCNGGVTNSVFAQSSYSAASLSGTYAISFNSTGGPDFIAPDGSSPTYGAVGTLQFDGTGKVSGGEVTTLYGSSSCAISLTGTYTIQSTGLGTIATTPVVTSGGCSVSPSWKAALAAAQQGQSFNFASNDGTAGSAVKQ
jgi:hypothetical protein